MKTRMLPFYSVMFLFVFLGIQMGYTLFASVVEMLVTKDMAMGFATDPVIHLATLSLSAVVTIAVFLLARWAVVSKNFILTKPWAVLFWTVIAAFGAIVPSIWIQEFITWPEWLTDMFNSEQTAEVLAGLMSTTGGAFVIVILQPLAEEVVFRGAILRTLLRWKPERRWLMITLSALLFALAHMNPMQFIHPFLIGLLLGWMYERTGSIIPGTAYHWINNAAAVVLMLLYPQEDPMTDVQLSDIWGQGRVYLAIAFSLCIFVPAVFQLNHRMRRAEMRRAERPDGL